MNNREQLKNNYYFITNILERDSTLDLVLEQDNLLGINIFNHEIKFKNIQNLNSVELNFEESIDPLFSKFKDLLQNTNNKYNVIVGGDFQESVLICAVLELVCLNNQYDLESYKRITQLFKYYFNFKKQKWSKHPIPTKAAPWKMINGENSKKYDVIENYLNSDKYSTLEKIQITVDYIKNNKLPFDSIKEVEDEKFKKINLIENKEIVIKNTLIPQISYIVSKSTVDFNLGYNAAPIVLLELKDPKIISKESKQLSNIYIKDFDNLLIEKETLLEELKKVNDSLMDFTITEIRNNVLNIKYVDTSKFKIEQMLLIIGDFLKKDL